jgi:hypothetical protein
MNYQANLLASLEILKKFIEMRYEAGYTDAEIIDELSQKIEDLKKRLN